MIVAELLALIAGNILSTRNLAQTVGLRSFVGEAHEGRRKGTSELVTSRAAVTPPPGWGQDGLTRFLDDHRGNQFATFANKRGPVADLIEIDQIFVKALEGQINPSPLLPAGFFLRAHSAYRAACGSALAGQIYELQALLRLCLEHAGYAIYVGDDDERWERWMRRQESDRHRKAVRAEFQHNKISAAISSRSTRMGEIYEGLYERLIDFGAHPNEMGYSMGTKLTRDKDVTRFETKYLDSDGIALDFALKTTAQVGIWVLQAIQLTYPIRFQLLQLRGRLDALRARY